MPSRRALLFQAASALALAGRPAWADVELAFANGKRPLTGDFPQKGQMVLQRVRPPLLETQFSDFDGHLFTPNDKFFVRWHWNCPSEVDTGSFRLRLHGAVERELSLSLDELAAYPKVEIAAVNQCSGNSRGFFVPRVPGGQWGNGAMGNARWTGVRLKDVLERAGVRPGAVAVRFSGLEPPTVSDGPWFRKSLTLEHANSPEVMIAYAMNGADIPLLNGYPIRLVVPGWYSTYWVKMLNDIEVLDAPDDNFWMTKAYLVPGTPHADMKPGEANVPMVPISRMVPRSFITNVRAGAALKARARADLRGLAMGGDCGVAKVDVSGDGGQSWKVAVLGHDEGPYSFRQWTAALPMGDQGKALLMVRCTNTKGEIQPDRANWNGGGYMRNVIERTPVRLT